MPEEAVRNIGIFRPERDVRIDGKSLPEKVLDDVVEVVFSDAIDDIDGALIKVRNSWDAKTSSFPYSGIDTFAPGKDLELSMGYRGGDKMQHMFKGRISAISPHYPSNGSAIMTIQARSLQADLLTQQVTQVYQNMTDSKIAKTIGGRMGVTIKTDSGAEASEVQHEFVTQINTYDLVFLTQRARRLGYELMLDKRNDGFDLYFGPSAALRSEPAVLKYGENLVEFTAAMDTTDQVDEVTVTSWDTLNKELISGTSARADFPALNKLDGPIGKAVKNRKEIIANLPAHDAATAKALASGAMERIMKSMVTGSGVTVGTPTIRCGRIVSLDGLDKRFNGQYMITGTKHSFSAKGYRTLFTCRREEI